jgi:hypothetical protein
MNCSGKDAKAELGKELLSVLLLALTQLQLIEKLDAST